LFVRGPAYKNTHAATRQFALVALPDVKACHDGIHTVFAPSYQTISGAYGVERVDRVYKEYVGGVDADLSAIAR